MTAATFSPRLLTDAETAQLRQEIEQADNPLKAAMDGIVRNMVSQVVGYMVKNDLLGASEEVLKTHLSPCGESPAEMPKPLSISGPRDSISPNCEGSSGRAAATQSSLGVKGI